MLNILKAACNDDGVHMSSNTPAILGSESIRAWSQAFLALFRAQFTLSVDEVRVAGGWAFERDTYKINLPPKTGGEPMQEIGKYTTIYERQPGSAWGIAHDIRNSNNSPFIGR